jgi:hypothetical protein
MKKLFLILTITLMTASVSQAQKMKIGIKGGVNFATLGAEGLGKLKSHTGYHVGGVIEIPIFEYFSIQPEVLYSIQGASYSGNDKGVGIELDIDLNYIQVPIMAKFNATDTFSIEIGPQVGYLNSSKSQYKGTIDGIGIIEGDDLFEFESIDVAISIGATYRLPIGVFLSARYNMGQTNLNDKTLYDSFFGDLKLYNKVFQLSVGFSF